MKTLYVVLLTVLTPLAKALRPDESTESGSNPDRPRRNSSSSGGSTEGRTISQHKSSGRPSSGNSSLDENQSSGVQSSLEPNLYH